MQKPVFATVIIPTFNQANYLPAALDSLLGQSDKDWEAIIVNDGSTDNTAEIAESYARRDSRIRCIHKINGGVASALNTGLANACGCWIHWLSSDDMFEPDKLTINRRWIERYPETKFFFSYFTLLRDATGVREKRGLWGPIPDPAHQLLTLFYRNFISGITICVNRTAWQSVGNFDETLRYAQDYDQWLRLLQRYQGRLISEWTVISRNHADQGSETFPDACYFDTAKAAIKFINEHGFRELVPWLDFNSKEEVRKAVSYALDVASDRTAFLYSSGVHPALLLRVVEWVFSASCDDPELRTLVRRRVAENSLTDGNNDWVWMWRQLATAIHSEVRACVYHPLEPIQLELSEYRQRSLRGDRSAAPLRDYLVKFESTIPNDLKVKGTSGPRVALLLGAGSGLETYVPVLLRLAERGTRIVGLKLVGAQSPMFWRKYAWGELISVAAYDRDCLPWLGEVELIVTLPEVAIPLWLQGIAEIELVANETADRIEGYLDDTYFAPKKKRRPVVFLERVLWGGGAERVVMDVVRYLDQRLYHPVVLTMFDEHSTLPELPSHVATYNCRSLVQARAQFPHFSSKISEKNRLFDILRHIYQQLLSVDMRSKLRLRQRLIRLRQIILSRITGIRPMPKSDFVNHVANESIELRDDSFSLDYVAAAAHHNNNAEATLKMMADLGSEAVLVAVMEEAAVAAWLAQGGRRFPYLVSLHTLESQCMADLYRVPMRRRSESHWLSSACNTAHAVTLPSVGCVEDLRSNFSVIGNNIRKLWNPIDCATVRRLSFQHDADALAWRDRADSYRLVHVGRLDPQKNHDLLLDVCVELRRRSLRVSLTLVGEGYDRQRIEKRITELDIGGMVKLVGERKNPFPWMKAADALLLTSHFEAFALVLVEAMVCGTPVVAVDCPTGPAEVLDNGKYGVLVPNYDVVALADAVERLMADSEIGKQLVVHGYERAAVFDIKRIVKEWQSLIDSVPSVIDHSHIYPS